MTAIARSLNGWAGIQSWSDPRLVTRTVPGTKKSIHVREEIAPVLLNLLARVNKEVLPLNPGPLDSYEYREARLGGGMSNHGSGTAIDFRYDILKADHLTHMTHAQRAKMESILDDYKTADGHRLFGWGGEWRNGVARDEMHIEVGQNWQVGRAITANDFSQFVARHHLRADGTTGAPSPAAPKPATSNVVHLHLLKPGKENAEVKQLQRALKARGFDPGPLDGQFGPKTQTAVQRLQRSLGFRGQDADGVPGQRSLASLGFRIAQ